MQTDEKKASLPSYEKTLRALQRSPKPLTMRQWAKAAGKDVSTLSRQIQRYIDNGDVVKVAPKGGDRSHRYRPFYGLPEELVVVNKPNTLSKIEFLQLLVSWSKKTWDPKAFQSARSLPVGIAQLYGYAVEASYGSKISQEDLDSVHMSMQEFLGDLQSLVKVVAGILQTEEAWNEKKFVEFLLSDRDPTQIQEFVHRVRELN